MYLIPLVRTNRAIAASLLYPQHPLQAIAASEIISVFGPVLNPKLCSKIVALTIAMMIILIFIFLLKIIKKHKLLLPSRNMHIIIIYFNSYSAIYLKTNHILSIMALSNLDKDN